MKRTLCYACWAGFAVACALIVGVAIGSFHDWKERLRQQADRSPVIDYGAAGTAYIKQKFTDPKPAQVPTIVAGSKAFVCIDDARWLRACPSVLKWWMLEIPDDPKTPQKRLDFDEASTTRSLHHDGVLGPLSAKCREWMVPELPSGRYVQTGIVSSFCPHIDRRNPIMTHFPRLEFVVKATP